MTFPRKPLSPAELQRLDVAKWSKVSREQAQAIAEGWNAGVDTAETDAAILATLAEGQHNAAGLAACIGISAPWAYTRLRTLMDRGHVCRSREGSPMGGPSIYGLTAAGREIAAGSSTLQAAE